MPVQYDIHRDEALTNLLVGYVQGASDFVADRAFPILSVTEVTGEYAAYNKSDFLRDEMEERAPSSDYAEVDYHATWTTYKTKPWALATRVADETVTAATDPVAPDRDAVAFLTQKLLINHERQFATVAMATSVWGPTAGDHDGSVTAKFSTIATSDPIGDVLTGARTIRLTGVPSKVDTIVCGMIVADRLKVHPDILDRIKYVESTAPMEVVLRAMATVFGVGQFLVSEAVYESADENATSSVSAIIDDDLLILAGAQMTPGMMTVMAGKTFTWEPGGGRGTIGRVRLDAVDADQIRVKTQYVQQVVASAAGYFYADCTD